MKDLKVILYLALLASLAAILTSCARMGTKQGDKSVTTRSYELDDRGKTNRITVMETRETSTRAGGLALASGSSTFEGLDASQDGKAQGLKVAKTSQTSDIDKLIDLFGSAARIGAAMYGIPTGGGAAQTPPPIQTPPGMKWILVPIDDAPSPRPKMDPAVQIPGVAYATNNIHLLPFLNPGSLFHQR